MRGGFAEREKTWIKPSNCQLSRQLSVDRKSAKNIDTFGILCGVRQMIRLVVITSALYAVYVPGEHSRLAAKQSQFPEHGNKVGLGHLISPSLC